MKIFNVIKFCSIILLCVLQQSCIVAAVGAGMGAVKWGNAQKQEANVKCRDSFNQYMTVMMRSKERHLDIKEYCKDL